MPSERREVFRGNLIRVEVWSGRNREIVRHPGACGVVALTASGEVVLVRQRREAIGDQTLEIPAGIRDVPGEAPEATALRELEEEAGYRAASIDPLGRFHTSPGFTDEQIDLFLARVAEPSGRPEQGVEVDAMPFQDAVEAVLDGRITDAKTAVGLLLAERWLNRASV